jgi:hypothetical protein
MTLSETWTIAMMATMSLPARSPSDELVISSNTYKVQLHCRANLTDGYIYP